MNWFDAAFQFLFKYRPTVFERGDLAFGAPGSVMLLLVAAGVLGIPAVLSYTRVRGKSTRRDRWVLGLLRGSAIMLLLICLFRPVILLSAAVPQRNYVGVLIDDSQSMRIADGASVRGGRLTRADVVRSLLGGRDSALRAALAERFQVRYFRFAHGAQRIAAPDDVGFGGNETRLGDAIEQARQELAAVPLSGLVVLTDGADNARAPLGDELLALRARGVPVFTVGIGRERFDRDVEIQRVETPRHVLAGSALIADLLVRQRGFDGARVPVVVEDGGRVVSTQEIALPPGGDLAPVRVHVTLTEAGPRTLTFRIPPQPGEQVTQNNAQQALVDVRDDREKILYVEGEPRYEMRFVRAAVASDSNVQLVVLQRTAENKFLRLNVDNGEELAGGFPKTRAELFRYRAIILGSVEASFFTHDQLQMLADFVSVRGGGLLLLGGRRAFAEGGYAGTALADVMPVIVQGQAVPDSLTFFADLKVRLTPAGQGAAVTQVGATEALSTDRWRSMPAVTSVNRIRGLKPGAVALLEGTVPDGGRSGAPGETVRDYEQPVLCYQRFGRGLAIAMPVQDTYLWRMSAEIPVEDRTFETFWRQLLRWLTSDVPDPVQVTAATDVVGARQAVTLGAEVADSAYVRRNDARVVAHVQGPSGATRDVPMDWAVDRDGEYRASFTPGESGTFRITVEAALPRASARAASSARSRSGSDAGTVETLASAASYLRVADSSAAGEEFVDAEMRAPLLRRIADETGGRFYTPATVHSLPEDVALSKRGVTVVNQMDLWDMPVIFLLLVSLVSAEWAYRKARGLA